MKATLNFNLDDEDDRINHFRCVKSLSMAIVLFQITRNLKKKLISDNHSEDYIKGIEDTLVAIEDVLFEHDINIDSIIY